MKTIITIITLVVVTVCQSQNFIAKAVYKTSKKANFLTENENKNIDKNLQEKILQKIQEASQKTFFLFFDKTTSSYKEELKLNAPKPNFNGIHVRVTNSGGFGNGSVLYKNLKQKRYTHKTDVQGKVFLIKDTIRALNWQLVSETKNIGKYTCNKAIFKKQIERIKTIIVNGETKKTKQKEIKTITAWYTPEIPISNGPANYDGLPGLILEVNDGEKVIVCSEIQINPKKTIKITEPKKGKEVDKLTFSTIQRKKSKDVKQRLKNGSYLENGM